MNTHVPALSLLLFVFSFAQAAPATVEEELAQDHLKVMERFVEIIGTLTDAASARKAQPELTALNDRNNALFRKAKTLNISRERMVEYVRKNHKARGTAVFEGMFAAMDKLSKVREFDKMGQYISKPVNELSGATWVSW